MVRKPIPIPTAMKTPEAGAALEKEWTHLQKPRAWDEANVTSKSEVIRTVHFATSMDLCHLKNSELEKEFQTYKGPVVLRGDTVKDDSGNYSVLRSEVLRRHM